MSNITTRLSIMMFLQFFIWGVWWVPMSMYMATDRIGMEGLIFLAFLSQPIAAIISPFFLGLVADRYFPSEKVLGVLHILGGIVLFTAPFFAELADGAGRNMFIAMVILHMLCYMPTISLTNTVAFANMTNPEKQFPMVRVFGTIGWIVSGLLVGIGFNAVMDQVAEETIWPFRLGAAVAIGMGLYSFSLPHTPPPLKGKKATPREIVGLDAVSQLSSRSFWTFIIASMLICIPLAAYYAYTAMFIGNAGVQNVAAWMSTGQMSEVLFMLLMPLAFARLGVKWMLLVGMGAWVLRYVLFAVGAPDQVFPLLLIGIVLHGICYDFFFVTGMVYVEKKAPQAIRGQAQGFLVQMTLGVGMFIGMIVSGQIFGALVEGTEGAERMQAFQTFWAIPAVFALMVMIGFALLFKDDGRVAARGVGDADIAEAAARDEQP